MSITKISPSVVDFDDGITITVDDNSDALTLTSTDADASIGPVLNLYRNSSSPADVDLVGSVKYVARNDNSQDVTTFTIQNYITDVSDGTEDAASFFYLMEGGSLRERIGLGSSATVINEDGLDVDFRVESDGNANMLFVDGGKNTVAIGADAVDVYSSYAQLNIGSLVTIAGETASGASKSLQISHNAHLDTDGSWEAIATDEATNYYQHGGAHVFRAAAATTGGTDISWTTAGQFNTNGLCFGTDTAAANALDDYEEGTWTPAFANSVTAAASSGTYTKIGRTVHFQFQIGNSISDITSSTSIEIDGLPFSPSAGMTCGAGFGRFVDNGPFLVTYISSSGNLHFYEQSSGHFSNIEYQDLNSVSAYFYGQGSYET